MYFKQYLSLATLVLLCLFIRLSIANVHIGVRVNKCCERNEILVDLRCTDANETNTGKSIDHFRSIFFCSA